LYLPLSYLEIIPVLNPSIFQLRCREVTDQIVELIGCERSSVNKGQRNRRVFVLTNILKAVVARVPLRRRSEGPLQAMIFDSVFIRFVVSKFTFRF